MNIRKLLDWRKLAIYSHRWLGIGIILMFLVWTVSGVILMYYGHPQLTTGERLLRLEPILLEPSAVWPDEIFQASEQAHRLVYGSGLIPWEFQFGARSWLLPGVIAVLMELARTAGDGPDYYLPLIAIAFAGLAALPVACCFLWCRRLFGFAGAVVAGMAVATAPELVYFGARTLSEVAAGHREHGPRDVGGLIGGEEGDRRGLLVQGPGPLEQR